MHPCREYTKTIKKALVGTSAALSTLDDEDNGVWRDSCSPGYYALLYCEACQRVGIRVQIAPTVDADALSDLVAEAVRKLGGHDCRGPCHG